MPEEDRPNETDTPPGGGEAPADSPPPGGGAPETSMPAGGGEPDPSPPPDPSRVTDPHGLPGASAPPPPAPPAVPPAPASRPDEVLERAVDRHMAEQRALREALNGLREQMRSMVSDAPQDVEGRLKTLVEEAVVPLLPMLEELGREVREAAAKDDTGAAVRAVSEDLAITRSRVDAVSADVEGLAQALIDLNAGLRDWAERLEEDIGQLRGGVAEIGEAAAEALERATERREAEEALGERVASIEKGMADSAELFSYLADQVEDLDRLMGSIGDLPEKLDGAVSQALRRTMAARAKLDKEAETALDAMLEDLEETVAGLEEATDRATSNEENVRRIAEEQIDLASRVEGFKEEVLERILHLEETQARRDESLAAAIDALAQGRDPKARQLVKASGRKPGKAKREAKPPKAKAAKREGAKREGAKQASGSRRRSSSAETTGEQS